MYSIDLSRGKYPDLEFCWTPRHTILEVNEADEIMRRFDLSNLTAWEELEARGLNPVDNCHAFEGITDDEIIKFFAPRRGLTDCLIECVSFSDEDGAKKLFELFPPDDYEYDMDEAFGFAREHNFYSMIKFLCDYM